VPNKPYIVYSLQKHHFNSLIDFPACLLHGCRKNTTPYFYSRPLSNWKSQLPQSGIRNTGSVYFVSRENRSHVKDLSKGRTGVEEAAAPGVEAEAPPVGAGDVAQR
jgi:hypothetical protein